MADAIARTHDLSGAERSQLKVLIRTAGANHQLEPEKIAARIDAIEQLMVRQGQPRVRRTVANPLVSTA